MGFFFASRQRVAARPGHSAEWSRARLADTIKQICSTAAAAGSTSMNFFFWLLLNLVVPIVVPVFTLALTVVTHGYGVARQLVIGSVRDGQLLWSATALSASAIYDAVIALEARGATPVLELAVAGFCVFAFVSSVIVMMATTKTCNDERGDQRRSRRLRPPIGPPGTRITGFSIGLVSAVSICYAALHLYLR